MIKNCPFCGSEAKVKCIDFPLLYKVECSGCKANTELTYKDRAIRLWNAREQEKRWDELLKSFNEFGKVIKECNKS